MIFLYKSFVMVLSSLAHGAFFFKIFSSKRRDTLEPVDGTADSPFSMNLAFFGS